jgi:hypothetical protein
MAPMRGATCGRSRFGHSICRLVLLAHIPAKWILVRRQELCANTLEAWPQAEE